MLTVKFNSAKVYYQTHLKRMNLKQLSLSYFQNHQLGPNVMHLIMTANLI